MYFLVLLDVEFHDLDFCMTVKCVDYAGDVTRFASVTSSNTNYVITEQISELRIEKKLRLYTE